MIQLKLYYSQIAFSLKQNFVISDESGKELYYSDNPGFSWKKRARVYEKATGKFLFLINAIPFSFPRTYEIEDAFGQQIATVKNQIHLFRTRMSILSIIGELELKGEFASREYTIENNGTILCDIHKKLFALAPIYEVDIVDEEHYLLYIAILITLNQMIMENNDSISTNNM